MAFYSSRSYFDLGRVWPRLRLRELFPRFRRKVITANVPASMQFPSGSFALTFEPITFTTTLVVSSASYALTFEPMTFGTEKVFSFPTGMFTLTFSPIPFSYPMTVSTVSYVTTFEPQTFTVTMPMDTGYFNIVTHDFVQIPPGPASIPGVTRSTTGPQAPVLPDWKPRSLAELLSLDSPLTNDQIRAKFPVPPSIPAQENAPTPATPLFPTPNLMVPGTSNEEAIALLHTLFDMED